MSVARHRLAPLFSFTSLAVVGASDSSNYGSAPYRALRELGFEGQYFPVNPRRQQVHGLAAHPTVSSLPCRIDAAVIAVGRDHVLPAVEACADQGATAVVIISAGFLEADEPGAALQARLAALARARDLLVVGPNCFGVASVANRCALFTGAGLGQARRGNVGVVSHSGGLMNEVISYGNARGVGFSHLASLGNEAGVTAADVLDFLVDDPSTEVVLAILETVRDPALFERVVERAIAARKPIVVLKLGASELGARAALTHTGALARGEAVVDGLLSHAGILHVSDIDELIEMGALLSGAVPILRQRPLERAAVIEISGGGKELVCDTAAAAGVELPQPTEAAAAALQSSLPGNVKASNPLDTGLNWGAPEMAHIFPLALLTFAAEPQIDVVVSRFTIPRTGGLGSLRPRLDEMVAARAAHPDRLFVVLSRTSDQFSDEWARVIREERVVFLQGYGRGMRALGKLAEYSRFLRASSGGCAAGGR